MEGPRYRIETAPGDHSYERAPTPWRQSPRVRIFFIVSGLIGLAGLVYAILQPPEYRSSASVLVEAPAAIDARSSEADAQHVAIQRKILLGGELLQATSTMLSERTGAAISPGELRTILRTESVPQTSLLDIAAYGAEARLLPLIVNAWIDAYSAAREAAVAAAQQSTSRQVEEELQALSSRLDEARTALQAFRTDNQIISAERQENEVLSRLDGLNRALNNAVEEEVKARSSLDSIRQAIDRGERVVPREEQRGLERLEAELQALRGEMAGYQRRFTDDYIRKDPVLRAKGERIATLEAEVDTLVGVYGEQELADARQRAAAASGAVRELERKQAAIREEVASFSNTFATHQALQEDLQRLEELYREMQARLVQVEVSGVTSYPQVDVIDRPGAAAERIGPDYLLIAAITAAAALVGGIVTVWLYGFLGTSREDQRTVINLSGVHMYGGDERLALNVGPGEAGRLASDPRYRLASDPPAETDPPHPDEPTHDEPAPGDPAPKRDD